MNVLRLVDVRIQSRQKTATVYFELRSKLSIGQLVRLAREKDCTLSELELYADSGYGDNLVCGTFTLWAEGRTVARRYPSGAQRRRGCHLPHQDLTTAAWDAEAFASASCFSAVPTRTFPLASRTAIPYNGEKGKGGGAPW